MMWTKMILARPLQARPYQKALLHMGKSKLKLSEVCTSFLRFDNEMHGYVNNGIFSIISTV